MTAPGFILRNVLRNKRRLILTVLSVAVSLFLYTVLQTALREMTQPATSEEAALRIVVRHRLSLANVLPTRYQLRIERMPGVEVCSKFTWFGGIYQDERNFFPQFACEADKIARLFAEAVCDPRQMEDFVRDRTGCLVGIKTMDRFGWKIGDRITLVGTIWDSDPELTIRAVYREGIDETNLFFHHEYYDELMNNPGIAGTFWIKAAGPDVIPGLIARIDRAFRDADAETKTETERAFALEFVSMFGNIRMLIGSISTVIVFTMVLVTASTMSMSIRERIRELSILKTLGFNRMHVLGLIVSESFGLAMAGGAIGCFGAWALFRSVDIYKLSQGFFMKFEVTPHILTGGMLIAATLGLVSCALPARNVLRLSIVDGLRELNRTMAIPLRYNVRNLRVRWRLTLGTALGVALVVAIFIMVMALAQGLKATYVSTGDERNLLVLRKGSTAESSSQIDRADVPMMRYLAGIARDAQGAPLVSAEINLIIYLARIDGSGGANVIVRGMEAGGLALRPDANLVEGRMFRPGLRECIVSRKIADRFASCRVGDTFRSGRTSWHVVGMFDASRTAYESEIWADSDEVRSVFNRDFYGSVLLRTEGPEAAAALVRRLEGDRRLRVRVLPEPEYYREQTKMAGPIQFIGRFLAVIMSVGAAFSAMNTMYAAVGARTREIGTLRVLGFRRREVYLSFLLESVLLSLAGGGLGCLFALPLNGVATGTIGWNTFAEVAFEFRITGELLARGMVFALVMGIIGGLLPARAAARMPVLDALRAA